MSPAGGNGAGEPALPPPVLQVAFWGPPISSQAPPPSAPVLSPGVTAASLPALYRVRIIPTPAGGFASSGLTLLPCGSASWNHRLGFCRQGGSK